VLGHVLVGRVLLNDEHAAVLGVVDPVVLHEGQVLPEVRALAVGLEAVESRNLALVDEDGLGLVLGGFSEALVEPS